MHEDMCLCHDFQGTGPQNFNLLNVTLVNDSAAAVKIYFEKKKKKKTLITVVHLSSSCLKTDSSSM